MDTKVRANKIHLEKAQYLHEKWKECKRLYDEQLRTEKDYGIYFSPTKVRHPSFKDFKPLDLNKYLNDWYLENMS